MTRTILDIYKFFIEFNNMNLFIFVLNNNKKISYLL